MSSERTKKHSAFLTAMEARDVDQMRKLAMEINLNVFHQYRDGQFNLLFHASINNSDDAFKILIDCGINAMAKNIHGATVLTPIIKRNQVQMAKLCIDSLDEESRRKFVNNEINSGWTALMSCAEHNKYEMAELLVQSGAEVNKVMGTGWSAMHAAAKMGHFQILELLLQNGGDKSIKAIHRNFGSQLHVRDVTTDSKIIQLLDRY